LARRSLAEAAFRRYLVQDLPVPYRVCPRYALSVYSLPTCRHARTAAAFGHFDVEMNLHVKLCAGWGLSPSDLEQAPPAVEMLA